MLLRVLGFNLAVAGAKLVLGYSTGAVSVISDGFHSLTDSASNIMGLVGLRAARKPPDEDHPYGHRKYETLAAAGIFVFLLFVVVEVLRSAISRLSGEAPARVTSLSFVVMLATLGINVMVVRYESARGRAVRARGSGLARQFSVTFLRFAKKDSRSSMTSPPCRVPAS